MSLYWKMSRDFHAPGLTLTFKKSKYCKYIYALIPQQQGLNHIFTKVPMGIRLDGADRLGVRFPVIIICD